MRKKRWIAGLLAGLLLVAGGCAAETTPPADGQEIVTEAETPPETSAAEESASQADGRWEAYQAKVQSLADQYGLLSEEDGLAWVETVGTTGLLEARTVDVTRDGQDELVCIWLNGTGIVSAVFEYVNGEVTETWSQQADGTGYYLECYHKS